MVFDPFSISLACSAVSLAASAFFGFTRSRRAPAEDRRFAIGATGELRRDVTRLQAQVLVLEAYVETLEDEMRRRTSVAVGHPYRAAG